MYLLKSLDGKTVALLSHLVIDTNMDGSAKAIDGFDYLGERLGIKVGEDFDILGFKDAVCAFKSDLGEINLKFRYENLLKRSLCVL